MTSRGSKSLIRIILYLIAAVLVFLFFSFSKSGILHTALNYYFAGKQVVQEDKVPIPATKSSTFYDVQIPVQETPSLVTSPVNTLDKALVGQLLMDVRSNSDQKEFEAVLALAETGDPEINNEVFDTLKSKYQNQSSILRDAFANNKITTTLTWVLESSSEYPFEPLGSDLLALCVFHESEDVRKEAFWNISVYRKGNPNAKKLLLRLLELGRDTMQALNTLKYFQEDRDVIEFIVKRFERKDYPEWLSTPVVRKTFRKENSEEIYVQEAILKRYSALDPGLLPMLDESLSAIQNQEWAASEKLLLNLLDKEPQSIDAVFLLMLTREYQKIEAAIARGLAGNRSSLLCESVATSGPISCFKDYSLSISSKKISLPGHWSTSEASGDGSYNLDKIHIFAQTSDTALINDPKDNRCWVKSKDLYFSRFVIEDESSNVPVWNIGCFPIFPFTFNFDPFMRRIRFTFYPSFWTLIQNATDHWFGPKHYAHLYELRDTVTKQQGLNLELFYPKIKSISWGLEAYLDMNNLDFVPAKRLNPINAETAFGRIDSDYGIPPGDLCGKYPHGPYGMKLCYHKFLTKSSNKKYRAFISEPHDNTY